MAHHHTSTASQPTSASQTQTLQTPQEGPAPSATLRLRGVSPATAEASEPRVRWAEDVVDNEGLGKKSSKVCCIYHKPKEDGASSDDSSDSSSSDDEGQDSEPDLSRAQAAGGKRGGGKGKGKGRAHRQPSPNAYERQPKHGGKKEG